MDGPTERGSVIGRIAKISWVPGARNTGCNYLELITSDRAVQWAVGGSGVMVGTGGLGPIIVITWKHELPVVPSSGEWAA